MNAPYRNEFASEREHLLQHLIKWLLIAGIPVLVPSAYTAWAVELWPVFWIDIGAYAVLLATFFFRNYRAQLITIIVLSNIVGSVVLYYTGLHGAGVIWFVFGIVVSALFGHRAVTAAGIILSSLIMSTYIVLIYTGVIGTEDTAWSTVIISINAVLAGTLLAVIIQNMERRLEAAFAQRMMLVRELQHRVRNNLQLFLSLASIADGDSGVRRHRILAVDTANDIQLQYQVQKENSVDARVLIEHLCAQIIGETGIPHEHVSCKVEPGSLLFSVKSITSAALVIADIIWELTDPLKHPEPPQLAVLGADGGILVFTADYPPDGRAEQPEGEHREKVSANGESFLFVPSELVNLYLEPEELQVVSRRPAHVEVRVNLRKNLADRAHRGLNRQFEY